MWSSMNKWPNDYASNRMVTMQEKPKTSRLALNERKIKNKVRREHSFIAPMHPLRNRSNRIRKPMERQREQEWEKCDIKTNNRKYCVRNRCCFRTLFRLMRLLQREHGNRNWWMLRTHSFPFYCSEWKISVRNIELILHVHDLITVVHYSSLLFILPFVCSIEWDKCPNPNWPSWICWMRIEIQTACTILGFFFFVH